MALKSMSIEKLKDLKSKVEAVIAEKTRSRRHELETELSKLTSYVGGGRRGRPAGRGGPKGSVAPKYRNPDNPDETWAGRGLRPRWLVAALKGGKKMEDFAIGGVAKWRAKIDGAWQRLAPLSPGLRGAPLVQRPIGRADHLPSFAKPPRDTLCGCRRDAARHVVTLASPQDALKGLLNLR